jgi:tripartite-type tricarboxylate transporter receptor subunit TctC
MKQLDFAATALIAAFALAPAAAPAQETWPSKPLRIVVPFAPGGATDIFARLLAQRLQPALGQTVVIDNRAGAGGVLGTDMVTKAEGDGYTLLFSSDSPITIGPNLYKTVPYDPMKDIMPIDKVVTVVTLLVTNPRLKLTSVNDLIAQAKQRKTPFTYGSSGSGAIGHLTGELFRSATGIELVHVPFKGGGPAITSLVGGEIDLSFATYPSAIQHVKSGRLTLLAVSNSKRSRMLPDTPSIAETGIAGVAVDNWHGLLAPPRLPRKIVARLDAEVAAIVNSKEFGEVVSLQGAEADRLGLAAFATFMRADSARWKQLIDKNKIRGE